MLDASVIRSIASWRGTTLATSLYVDVDGRRHPRWPDVERRVDQLLRTARAEQAPGTGGDASLDEDLSALRAWFARPLDRRRTRAVALFSRAAEHQFEAVSLPVTLRDRVVVDHEPDVAPLCLVASSARPVVVVALDRERWRVLRAEPAGEPEELDVLDDAVPRRIDVDRELAGFSRHLEELERAHVRRVARALEEELARRPAARAVLCGTKEAVAQVEAHLGPRAVSRVAGHAALGVDAPAAELLRSARDVLDRDDDARRQSVAAVLRARISTGTRAVAGLPATLDALAEGSVTAVVVERSFSAPGGRCEDCRLLVARSGRCPRCAGHVRAAANVVDLAITDAYLHGADLEAVDDGALGEIGRIGALTTGRAAVESGR